MNKINLGNTGFAKQSENYILKQLQALEATLQETGLDQNVRAPLTQVLSQLKAVGTGTDIQSQISSFQNAQNQWSNLAPVVSQLDPAFYSQDDPALMKAQGAISTYDDLKQIGKKHNASPEYFSKVHGVAFGQTTKMTPEFISELEEMIRDILDNGIETLQELRNLMSLMGILGKHINVDLAEEIKDMIKDFIQVLVSLEDDPEKLLQLLSIVKGILDTGKGDQFAGIGGSGAALALDAGDPTAGLDASAGQDFSHEGGVQALKALLQPQSSTLSQGADGSDTAKQTNQLSRFGFKSSQTAENVIDALQSQLGVKSSGSSLGVSTETNTDGSDQGQSPAQSMGSKDPVDLEEYEGSDGSFSLAGVMELQGDLSAVAGSGSLDEASGIDLADYEGPKGSFSLASVTALQFDLLAASQASGASDVTAVGAQAYQSELEEFAHAHLGLLVDQLLKEISEFVFRQIDKQASEIVGLV